MGWGLTVKHVKRAVERPITDSRRPPGCVLAMTATPGGPNP